MFFKRYLNGRLELIESDEKGFIWFKLNKEYSYLTTDTYFCCCYIPPEDSRLYRNPNALLDEVDFLDLLNNDIRKYSDLGIVCWLGADMNGRSAQPVDYTPDVHMNRYIDIQSTHSRFYVFMDSRGAVAVADYRIVAYIRRTLSP